MKFIYTIFGVLVVVCICACSTNNQRLGASRYWGNYRCEAVDQGSHKTYEGWSTNESDAKESAIHKCESVSKAANSCLINSCVNS